MSSQFFDQFISRDLDLLATCVHGLSRTLSSLIISISYIQVPDTHSLFTFSSQFISVSYSHCTHVLTPSNSLAQEPSTFLLSSNSFCLCLLVFLIHLRLHRRVFLPHLPISVVSLFLHLPVWLNPLQIKTSANCLVLISQMLITVQEKQFHRVEQFGTIIIVGNIYWGFNLARQHSKHITYIISSCLLYHAGKMPRIPLLKSLKFICIRQLSAAQRG